jgi:hypothetical protein
MPFNVVSKDDAITALARDVSAEKGIDVDA